MTDPSTGPNTDRSDDPSPFAWIMAALVGAVTLGGILQQLVKNRRRTGEPTPPA